MKKKIIEDLTIKLLIRHAFFSCVLRGKKKQKVIVKQVNDLIEVLINKLKEKKSKMKRNTTIK